MKKYCSYSELIAWERDPVAYVRRYVEGIEEPPSPEATLGRIIHQAIENPHFEWLKAMTEAGMSRHKMKVVRDLLNKVEKKRPASSEVAMRAETEDGVKLIAILDGLDKENRELDEFKTSEREEAWSQWQVDFHKQLSFYGYIFWLTHHAYFRIIRLHYLNTAKGTIKTFETVRSRRDIQAAKEWTEAQIEGIKAAGYWEKRLTRAEREGQQKLKLMNSLNAA